MNYPAIAQLSCVESFGIWHSNESSHKLQLQSRNLTTEGHYTSFRDVYVVEKWTLQFPVVQHVIAISTVLLS